MAELIVQCDEEEFDAALFSRCGGAACEADAPLSVEVVFTDAEGIVQQRLMGMMVYQLRRIADSIEIKKTEDGLDTLIHWYLPKNE